MFKSTLFAAFALVSTLVIAAPADGGESHGMVLHGSATVYHPAGFGACGIVNTDADIVAGVSQEIFDGFGTFSNPNDNPVCGRWILVNKNGASVRAKIVEKCGGCDSGSILLSPAAFKNFAPVSQGVVQDVNWLFTI